MPPAVSAAHSSGRRKNQGGAGYPAPPRGFVADLFSSGSVVRVLTAAAASAAAVAVALLGREKLVDREAHLAEQVAGAVGGRAAALLARHAEIVHRHQHLDVADQLHDGEDAQRNIDVAAVGVVAEIAAVAVADVGRDAAASAAAPASAVAAAAAARLGNARGEDDRLGDVDDAARQIAGGQLLRIAVVLAVLAREHLDVALAAVEDHLFLEYADTGDRRARAGASGVHIHRDLKEEGQVAGIVAAIERQRLDVDVCGDDLRPPGPYRYRIIHDLLVTRRKIYAQILQAVFVI